MDNSVKKCFINLIRHAIIGSQLDLTDFSKWTELYKLTDKQNMFGMIYTAIENENIDEAVKEKFFLKYASSLNQQIQQDHYSELVFGEFEKAGIDYLPMKGFTVRKLYPEPVMRTSCDVDFLVKKDDVEKMRDILRSFNFQADYYMDGRNEHDCWSFGSVVEFEPHVNVYSLFYKQKKFDVWQLAKKQEGYNHRYCFSDEDLYMMLLKHIKKHFMLGGCGARSVVDLYICNTKMNMDFNVLEEKLKAEGDYKFHCIMKKVANCWFNEGEEDEEIKFVSDHVLEKNIYSASKYAKESLLAKKEIGKNQAKIRYYFRVTFPRFQYMKEQYPLLNKLPILYPYFVLHRIVKKLFTKKGLIKNQVKEAEKITQDDYEYSKKLKDLTEDK